MHANLINAEGNVKSVKVGFSWTMFFFGDLVPLFRLDIFHFLVFGAIGIILGVISYGILASVFYLVMSFFYNKLYVKRLLEVRGFAPLSDSDAEILIAKGYMARPM